MFFIFSPRSFTTKNFDEQVYALQWMAQAGVDIAMSVH